MKVKMSVSMEEETIQKVKEIVKIGTFRNKSHLIELATQKYLEQIKNG